MRPVCPGSGETPHVDVISREVRVGTELSDLPVVYERNEEDFQLDELEVGAYYAFRQDGVYHSKRIVTVRPGFVEADAGEPDLHAPDPDYVPTYIIRPLYERVCSVCFEEFSITKRGRVRTHTIDSWLLDKVMELRERRAREEGRS